MSGTLKTGMKVALQSDDFHMIEKCIQIVIVRRLDKNGDVFDEYIERDDEKFIGCGSICEIGGLDNYTVVWDQFLYDPTIKRAPEKEPEPSVNRFVKHTRS